MPDLPELLDDPCILRGFADDNQEGVRSMTFYNWALVLYLNIIITFPLCFVISSSIIQ